jgi:hypothetical protein
VVRLGCCSVGTELSRDIALMMPIALRAEGRDAVLWTAAIDGMHALLTEVARHTLSLVTVDIRAELCSSGQQQSLTILAACTLMVGIARGPKGRYTVDGARLLHSKAVVVAELTANACIRAHLPACHL